jgi:deazaflavin-dependent oxidoreductase (nitroreductase family)
VGITTQVLRAHQKLYIRSGGRAGHGMLGVPSLLLRTTGRRSGAERTNALIYARDGDDFLVVASNGGADNHPAWFLNLEANPDVGVQVGRERMAGRARAVDRSDPDFERRWRLVNSNNRDRYDAYQAKTSREIPLVAITPAEDAATVQ